MMETRSSKQAVIEQYEAALKRHKMLMETAKGNHKWGHGWAVKLLSHAVSAEIIDPEPEKR